MTDRVRPLKELFDQLVEKLLDDAIAGEVGTKYWLEIVKQESDKLVIRFFSTNGQFSMKILDGETGT